MGAVVFFLRQRSQFLTGHDSTRFYIGFPGLHCKNNKMDTGASQWLFPVGMHWVWYLLQDHALWTFGREKVAWIIV
jgi:hypothetical protein